MDLTLMKSLAEELSALLTGAVLRNISEIDKGKFVATFYLKEERMLLIKLKGEVPAACLLSGKKPAALVPSSFCMLLRKHFKNKKLLKVKRYKNEKIILMEFNSQLNLVIDFTRREGNLILLSQERALGSFSSIPQNKFSEDRKYVFPSDPDDFFVAEADSGGEKKYGVSEDIYFSLIDKERESEFEREKKLRLSLFSKEINKLEKRRSAISNDLLNLTANNRAADIGNSILANICSIKEGDEILECEDVVSGEALKIKLDPSLSPAENAAAYFSKFKKAKRGLPVLRQRLSETEKTLDLIKESKRLLEDADDWESLESASSPLDVAKPISKTSFILKSSPRRFKYGDYTIISGRNPEQNDEVSLKLAKKSDYWFHARGMGGSHVLITVKNAEKPPQEVIIMAATIAAYFSKGRKSSKVPVSCSLAKYVSKKKGMPAGMVAVSKESCVTVNPTSYDFLEWLKVNMDS